MTEKTVRRHSVFGERSSLSRSPKRKVSRRIRLLDVDARFDQFCSRRDRRTAAWDTTADEQILALILLYSRPG